MTELKEIYKCEVCGNIVEVLHTGEGELVCCGKPMVLQKENSEGEYAEKHAPVVEEQDGRFKVKIGKIEHPMEQEHYIEWIEASSDSGEYCKKFLKPSDKPEAVFDFKPSKSRMYCNVHGLWVSE